MSGGSKAATNGQRAENMFSSRALKFGIHTYTVSEVETLRPQRPYLVSKHPITKPYGSKKRKGENDFMLFTALGVVYVQVKNQNGSGTTDEKIAFSFDLAQSSYDSPDDEPFNEFWLVLHGSWWGQTDGQLEFFERKAKQLGLLCPGLTGRVVMSSDLENHLVKLLGRR